MTVPQLPDQTPSPPRFVLPIAGIIVALAIVTGGIAGSLGLRHRPPAKPTAEARSAETAPLSQGQSGSQAGASPQGAAASKGGQGAAPAPAPAGDPPGARPPVADRIRGLYLTGYTAGSERFFELLRYAKASGLNAFVIDAKDDDGLITFQTDIPLAAEIGANSHKIKDVSERVRILKENGMYAIARIVVFCDPILSRKRPEWAVTVNGRLFLDRRRLSWTSPYRKEVWEYNVAVAKAAARAGFQEIQFDYVRLPERDIPGFTDGVSREQRVAAISAFLDYAREELKPLGVAVSADVFGLTTTVTDDMKIGQEYAAVARRVDYISPMVYPSHYSPGNFGLVNPNARPYETVFNSMMQGRAKVPDLPITVHRPWIQDFSLGLRYGKAEVEAQIRALADAGIRSFLLWNPNNVYTPGVDYSLIDRGPKEPPPLPAPAQPAGGQAPSASPASPGGTAPAAGRETPRPSLPPNELGQVMVLEYHVIGPKEDRWARTPERFRQDLEDLYRRGYRPVNVSDLVAGRIDVPAGYTPVALTFDDGTEGQFRYVEKDGKRIVDPDSAVGILLEFHRTHPDWPLRATFYVYDNPFEQRDYWKEKIRFLVEQGFEVGNHTVNHANLGKLDAAGTAREIGGLQAILRQAVPGLRTVTLALPYGAFPREPEAARRGSYQGVAYDIAAFLLVGANPAPSPYSKKFDPWRVPRIQAVDSRYDSATNIDRWLAYFDEKPERRFVSDGDPGTVTVPAGSEGDVRPGTGRVVTLP